MDFFAPSMFKCRVLALSRAETRPIASSYFTHNSTRNRKGSSFVRGATDVPLLEYTFPRFFAERLLPEYSSGTALISTHEPAGAHGGPVRSYGAPSPYLSWSFEDLDLHIYALAKGMLKLGVRKGDRVGVVMGNIRCIYQRCECETSVSLSVWFTSAYAALQWACARIGAIIVTINPAYKMSEMVGTKNAAYIPSSQTLYSR